MDAKGIATLLAQRAEEVARYLLPAGKKIGNEYKIGGINGEPGSSLGICLSGDRAGLWADFAEGGSCSGDMLDLWCAVRNVTITEAIKQASQYLGIAKVNFEPQRARQFVRPSPKSQTKLSLESPVSRYLRDQRKLFPETIHAFKISEEGNKIVFPYYRNDELIFIKYLGLTRPNGKKQIIASANCEPCLFGWHLMPDNARTVTLCEGEIDAMTLHQYGFNVLSVPFGGGTGNKHKWLEFEFDHLARFDDIYLCFDNDEAGVAATAELAERLGSYRCRVIQLPFKDANECLQKGVSADEMQQFFAAAKSFDPHELKQASTLVKQVVDEFYPAAGVPIGYSPPWSKTVGKVIFRPGELSIWTGINGHGKSQFLGHILLESMRQGARVCIASLELRPSRLLMRLTRQAGGLKEPSVEYIQAIHQWYEDRLWIFDLVGVAKIDRLLEVFLYARQRYGVDVFLIDSLLKLDISEDDYKAQKSFIESLCDFKHQHNCHVHLIVHPRKGIDETRAPGKLDNKGTGAISDLADNCFAIWRNKAKEELQRVKEQGVTLKPKELDVLKQPDCFWLCDKQRNGDWEGKISLWFDLSSFQYLGGENHKPKRFVDFSIGNDDQPQNINNEAHYA